MKKVWLLVVFGVGLTFSQSNCFGLGPSPTNMKQQQVAIGQGSWTSQTLVIDGEFIIETRRTFVREKMIREDVWGTINHQCDIPVKVAHLNKRLATPYDSGVSQKILPQDVSCSVIEARLTGDMGSTSPPLTL